MKEINKSPILKTIISIKDNSAIFKIFLFVLVFSIFHFFTFYYGHSNTRQPFEFLILNFYTIIFVCLLISFLSFYKKISFWKIFLGFSILEIILIFIPAGFGTIGLGIVNEYCFVIGLLVLSKIISLIIDPLYKNVFVNIFMTIVVFIACVIALVFNYKDLSVKTNIKYHNNSMFDTVEECSLYILPKRESDCVKDFKELHDRWEKMKKEFR